MALPWFYNWTTSFSAYVSSSSHNHAFNTNEWCIFLSNHEIVIKIYFYSVFLTAFNLLGSQGGCTHGWRQGPTLLKGFLAVLWHLPLPSKMPSTIGLHRGLNLEPSASAPKPELPSNLSSYKSRILNKRTKDTIEKLFGGFWLFPQKSVLAIL